MGIPVGTGNFFPQGQCTWWASFRYHQLTGKYIPWGGDAWQWFNGAHNSQWSTSTTAPQGIPSIVILEPGVQGAGGLGHVAVVEHVNPDGSVVTSNQNWGLTAAQRASTQTVTFHPGPGVSFAWFPGTTGSSSPSTGTSSNGSTGSAGNTNGSTDWVTQLRGEGIKTGLFVLALVLFGFGMYLTFTTQVDGVIKKGVEAAKIGVLA